MHWNGRIQNFMAKIVSSSTSSHMQLIRKTNVLSNPRGNHLDSVLISGPSIPTKQRHAELTNLPSIEN